MNEKGQLSPSGVWIAEDFRSNLIIDRYDPVFADMRASKLKHLKSANSEDAVTWNVFRSLRQIVPSAWFPTLWTRAFPKSEIPAHDRIVVKLWLSVPPPIGLLAEGDEGASEIDVVIEAPAWVWFLEAKHRSDISTGTTTRPGRDQVLRNLDVGSYYAGVRDFYFSLLISDAKRSPQGVQRVNEYANREQMLALLGHRPDKLVNQRGLGMVTWLDLKHALKTGGETATREDEKWYATRAVEWMTRSGWG